MRVDASAAEGVQVGDGNVQVNIYGQGHSGRPGTVVVGDVPQEPAAFQPRSGLMKTLRAAGRSRVSVVFAVTGIRGVGKTQVAAAYARRGITEGWRLVAWVDASDEASILGGLSQVAAAAGVGPAGEDARVLASRVRHWLEGDGARRLIVFDNAVDLDVLRPFVPAAGAARVVITSSRRSAVGLGIPVPIDVFTKDEALAFLAERTGRDDEAGARELAGELGWLPLGLAQAAALIAREGLDYGTYLGRLRSLPVAGYLRRADGDSYPYRLAEAVTLSLAAAEVGGPSGVRAGVMGMVAVLAETGVPRRLLHLAGEARALGDGLVPADQVDEGIGDLADASLLGFTSDDSVVAHRLVMRVARERLAAGGGLPDMLASAVRILEGLRSGIKEPWRYPARVRELVVQVGALAAHVRGHPDALSGNVLESLLRLRLGALYLLNELGDSTGLAIVVGEPLITDFERVLGADHPHTLASRNNLALAYRDAGRVVEAIPLLERTLADCERVLGTNNLDTLASRNNLAMAYQAARRTAEAITQHERTLAGRERALGINDPDVLASRNNLALAYQDAGRATEAIPLLERTLADFERLLGADHPSTGTSRNNLAAAYRDAGRTAEAIPLLERTLADFERLLGADHPSTLTSRNNLALAYQDAGRAAEAVTLDERTLADRERLLGADHPDTLVSRNNLALAYRNVGRAAEAITLDERTLADRERLLGADHPYTLASRSNLAAAYQDAGRTAEAIPLLELTLADRERVLGADHPNTLASRNYLATAYRDAGRTAEAFTLYERTFADRERVLGADHPNTLASRSNLAIAYLDVGRTTDAIALLERTLADCERVLGADHPYTIAVRGNLAELTGEQPYGTGK